MTDEVSLFHAAMRGVKPIYSEQALVGKVKVDKARFALLRERASVSLDASAFVALSDGFVLDALPEELLYWAANGVQKSQMQRLARGQCSFAGSLDLHGFNVEKAREQLLAFISEGQRLAVRCVRVVHGKASSSAEKQALLKSRVNSWLRQHPEVLGFASCLPRHGGTGAVYVLLKSQSATDEKPF